MNASPETRDHIVKSYDDELKRLTGEIQRMGEIALAQLDAAIDAVMARDSAIAMKIVQGDGAIDVLEQEVSHDVVRLLALRQPMARDLREVYGALRISADIERIGDYAKNVAKRSVVLNESAMVPAAGALPELAKSANARVRDAIPITSGSSALRTATPSSGSASTSSPLACAIRSRLPNSPRWATPTLSTTATVGCTMSVR